MDPIQKILIRRILNEVHIAIDGLGVGISWSHGLALAQTIQKVAKVSKAYADQARLTGILRQYEGVKETVSGITVESAGPALIFQIQGKRWFECNYRTAPQIAEAIRNIAATIEEEHKAAQVISDEAFLLRTGLPVGLTRNTQIIKEAWKKAEDVKFDGMVEPKEVFYPPMIIQHQPAGES